MGENNICVTASLEDFEKAPDALLRKYKTYSFFLSFEEAEDK